MEIIATLDGTTKRGKHLFEYAVVKLEETDSFYLNFSREVKPYALVVRVNGNAWGICSQSKSVEAARRDMVRDRNWIVKNHSGHVLPADRKAN